MGRGGVGAGQIAVRGWSGCDGCYWDMEEGMQRFRLRTIYHVLHRLYLCSDLGIRERNKAKPSRSPGHSLSYDMYVSHLHSMLISINPGVGWAGGSITRSS